MRPDDGVCPARLHDYPRLGYFPVFAPACSKEGNPCRTLEPYPDPPASLLITSLKLRAFDTAIRPIASKASAMPLQSRKGICFLLRTLSYAT